MQSASRVTVSRGLKAYQPWTGALSWSRRLPAAPGRQHPTALATQEASAAHAPPPEAAGRDVNLEAGAALLDRNLAARGAPAVDGHVCSRGAAGGYQGAIRGPAAVRARQRYGEADMQAEARQNPAPARWWWLWWRLWCVGCRWGRQGCRVSAGQGAGTRQQQRVPRAHSPPAAARVHAHLAGRGCPRRMASASSAGMRSSGSGSSSPSRTASSRAPILTAGRGTGRAGHQALQGAHLDCGQGDGNGVWSPLELRALPGMHGPQRAPQHGCRHGSMRSRGCQAARGTQAAAHTLKSGCGCRQGKPPEAASTRSSQQEPKGSTSMEATTC